MSIAPSSVGPCLGLGGGVGGPVDMCVYVYADSVLLVNSVLICKCVYMSMSGGSCRGQCVLLVYSVLICVCIYAYSI